MLLLVLASSHAVQKPLFHVFSTYLLRNGHYLFVKQPYYVYLSCIMPRSVFFAISCLWICPRVKEQLYHENVFVLHRDVQRCQSAVVLGIWVSSVVEKQLYYSIMPPILGCVV